jgi:hypothetical protein
MFNRILSSIGAPEEAASSGAVLEPSSSDPSIPEKFPDSGENTRGDQPLKLEESAVDLLGKPVRRDVEVPSVHLRADAVVDVRRVLLQEDLISHGLAVGTELEGRGREGRVPRLRRTRVGQFQEGGEGEEGAAVFHGTVESGAVSLVIPSVIIGKVRKLLCCTPPFLELSMHILIVSDIGKRNPDVRGPTHVTNRAELRGLTVCIPGINEVLIIDPIAWARSHDRDQISGSFQSGIRGVFQLTNK